MTTIKIILLALLAVVPCSIAWAQSERIVTNARMVGIGGAEVLDTYLSPLHYRGTELRYISHTLREKTDTTRLFHEIIHQGSLSLLENKSGYGGEMAGSYNFQYGWHWHLCDFHFKGSTLRLDVGGNIDANIGFIYNTRNSNNPAQARAYLNLTPTAAATYALHWRHPLAVRYEVWLPVAGVMFSPNYGQSYYEIFSKGNYDHNIVPTWVGNAPSMRQMLTVDYTLWGTTLRAGYLGDYQQASVNHLKSHIYTHAFVIGVVRKFSIQKIKQP